MKKSTKKPISILSLLLLLSITSLSFAQIRFGARAGLNLASMYGNGLSDLKTKMTPSYHVGGVAEYNFSDAFAIESGLFLSGKGTNGETSLFSVKVAPLYLEVPINAIYKIDLGSAKLQLFAGPYIGVGLGGKITLDDGNESESEDIDFGSNNPMFKRTDFGFNVGTGLEFSNLVLRLQYGSGLISISPGDDISNEIKNRVFAISVGYMFGGK